MEQKLSIAGIGNNPMRLTIEFIELPERIYNVLEQ